MCIDFLCLLVLFAVPLYSHMYLAGADEKLYMVEKISDANTLFMMVNPSGAPKTPTVNIGSFALVQQHGTKLTMGEQSVREKDNTENRSTTGSSAMVTAADAAAANRKLLERNIVFSPSKSGKEAFQLQVEHVNLYLHRYHSFGSSSIGLRNTLNLTCVPHLGGVNGDCT